MNEDIPPVPDTGNPLIDNVIDSMTRAWDQLVRQVDEIVRWSPGSAPGERMSPAAMADGELANALLAVASGLIGGIDPARQAIFPAQSDPRWRFNLPVTVESHVQAMFTEASDSFGLAVTGLKDRASSADLAVVGRLAEILARARWLLEPADAGLRRERGYALTADAITWLRKMSRAEEAGGAEEAGRAVPPGQPNLASEIADRTATMAARLDEIIEEDELQELRVPKRRQLLQAYLPGGGLELAAVRSAADARPGAAPSGLFYGEPGSGNAAYNFQRLHLTRAYWLAQSITLYAHLCDAAAPVLGRGDWKEIIATTNIRLRPLAQEAQRRYERRLQRGLHPGL